ncbi:ABC transporter permease [Catalinimonas niigatensis]|uniref:ABC transporter permease n=1 Tax=Catalinimonas niigatensis TaxID=1397264 RepID=UPI002665C890|nr:ABC transporter permease [Catalinimonas niigatensis]WPP51964.1 ABC transporter permease [Catalinimonas niigatensis]
MLRNYLLIAYRNLWHNKVYALINIFGLAISLTAALFIFQYVQFERSYDSFHENGDNIYRYIIQFTMNGVQEAPQHMAYSSFVPIIKRECSEVIEYARLFQNGINDFIISHDPADGTQPLEFLEKRVYYADATFMEIFSFPMILGDKVKGLAEPNSAVLSERMAEKLLGADWQKSDPIGKTIVLNGKEDFMIQGVFENVPENSHIKFEVLLSLSSLMNELNYDVDWHNNFLTYLQVEPTADIAKLETKIMEIREQRFGELMRNFNVDTLNVSLQAVKNTHLHSFGYANESEIRGSATTVQFLQITAFFILILAWINFVNLSTARAVKRAKEVGIRKVVGAGRRQLIAQFMLESFMINLLSTVLAVTLYQLCFPLFTDLVQKEIPLSSLLKDNLLVLAIVLVVIFGTLLAGGYSAFVLSSFKAVSIMKGRLYASNQGGTFRKSLMVFQFMISVGLIIGTFSVYQQLSFMKSYDKGYDLTQKLVVRTPMANKEKYDHQYESFKTILQNLPGTVRVTISRLSPGEARGKGFNFIENKKQPEYSQAFKTNTVDEDYLETYDIEILHGRGFSREFPSDKNAVVITEEVARQLGFDPVETALQEKVTIGLQRDLEFNIIGIVKNINLLSLKFAEQGAVFLLRRSNADQRTDRLFEINYFTIEVNDLAQTEEVIASIEAFYKDHFPGNPFEYFFLDDYFNAQYQSEELFGKVFTAASSLAIFIACLGLFGLSAFMVRQRTKEIGIRKVLGAPLQSILLLLSSDYIKLIAIAGLIALPIAYWSLNLWLESYIVRISLSWWLFLIPVAIVIAIALFTVSYQTIKAALANPVKSLRYE